MWADEQRLPFPAQNHKCRKENGQTVQNPHGSPPTAFPFGNQLPWSEQVSLHQFLVFIEGAIRFSFTAGADGVSRLQLLETFMQHSVMGGSTSRMAMTVDRGTSSFLPADYS